MITQQAHGRYNIFPIRVECVDLSQHIGERMRKSESKHRRQRTNHLSVCEDLPPTHLAAFAGPLEV
jgi:hypothetical protein